MTLFQLLPPREPHAKRLIFIRHGETDFNKNKLIQGRSINASLNETGRMQAQILAEFLRGYPFEKVVTSSLNRTKETVEPFIFRQGTPILNDARLDEMNFGKFEGRPYHEIESDLIETQEGWKSGNLSAQIPGGESPIQVKYRALQAIFDHISDSDEILFSIHGRLLRIIATVLQQKPLTVMHTVNHTNACIYAFDYENENFRIILENYTTHLEKEIVL